MPIKRYKPTTPGRRGASVLKHVKAGTQKPVPSLLAPLTKKAGRNSSGRITVRHKGGGAKRKYRIIDFVKPIEDVAARVSGIQYDPNRSAAIALLKYEDGRIAYTLAVDGLKVGDSVQTSRTKGLEIKPGNRMALKHIPAGITICNIELSPGKGASTVRSAGSSATVLSIEDDIVQIKMPSTEVRKFSGDCVATIGQVSNTDSNLVRLGKAGRMRHKGVRPRVRGKAMNPVDHPHGGGEGRAPIGLKHPKTPWGKPARGVPTRAKHKASNTLIIRKRKK
ncbi:50S ribosomal protein L2 [bacterium]|jgi:large subunit ribosomal protein L2|nr:50S ribosomal protein L2 [bacterium]MDP6571298.1 50S ribosomal protein L2 [Patescibacteria group bacterium]MDP6756106.1 50S ribosomal protein L2 [Patescibacteria group bacterium]|tara:strand:- start:7528 stop:8364 length:837 start_codon:yes stop_codon:yes gene_type:complete